MLSAVTMASHVLGPGAGSWGLPAATTDPFIPSSPPTYRLSRVMLKMMTFFQGLPGQQPVPGTLDIPRRPQKLSSTSEAESEASMSEASSEDLVPPLEAEVTPDRGKEEAVKKKKKKPKGLANMFSVFTKGRKKKGQPSSAEPEGPPESAPGLGGQPPGQLPTGRLGPQVGLGSRVRAGQGLGRAGLIGVDGPRT